MKLSAQKKRDRLRQIEVLVADPDLRIARLVRYVLENFGFKHIHMVKNGEEAIELLNKKPIDLVITEWPMEPVDGINFVTFVRNSDNIAYRDIPIIMLTGRAEQYDVELARDSGVTEFVVKPFTAKTISHRIAQVIDNPRSFIISQDFVGPDRRRRMIQDLKSDHRMALEELKKHATRRGNRIHYHIYDQEIIVQNPDRSLKQMLGADITAEAIFDDEIVKEAQDMILNMKDEFVSWVTVDINRLEHAYDALKKNPNDIKQLNEISQVSLTIKSQAGTFEYDFATAVGKLLHDFTEELTEVNDAVLTVIRKHIDTLYVIFSKEIHGQGPEFGKEVLDGLRLLIEKHAHIHLGETSQPA